MLVKTIDYVDYSGTTAHTVLRFNLTISELADYTTNRRKGNLSDKLLKIITTTSMAERVDTLTEILDDSYGIFFDDTNEFVKTPEMLRAFKRSAAYHAFISELAYDVNSASTFVMGIMPNAFSEMQPRELDWISQAATEVVNSILSEVTNTNPSEDE